VKPNLVDEEVCAEHCDQHDNKREDETLGIHAWKLPNRAD
jgi:hypothetical protein